MSLKKFNNVSRISTLCTFINLWIDWFNGFDDFDFNINLFILIVQCWLRFEFLSTFVTLVSPYLMTFDMHLKSTLLFEFLFTFVAWISWTFWNFLFPYQCNQHVMEHKIVLAAVTIKCIQYFIRPF